MARCDCCTVFGSRKPPFLSEFPSGRSHIV
jgi:hypothetical protein